MQLWENNTTRLAQPTKGQTELQSNLFHPPMHRRWGVMPSHHFTQSPTFAWLACSDTVSLSNDRLLIRCHFPNTLGKIFRLLLLATLSSPCLDFRGCRVSPSVAANKDQDNHPWRSRRRSRRPSPRWRHQLGLKTPEYAWTTLRPPHIIWSWQIATEARCVSVR